MKFLIDIQLPPRLKYWFTGKSHEAIHASELSNGFTLTDGEIWEIAKETNRIVVSKDVDFYDMSLLYDKPPVILLIRDMAIAQTMYCCNLLKMHGTKYKRFWKARLCGW